VFARSGPLLSELGRALPERPFAIECWDGGRLGSTTGDGPVFRVRSPAAVAHALRAPGQLGVGRAYVAGLLDPDDLDSALALLSTWKPPPLTRAARARLVLAAARACGVMAPPRPPAGELRQRGHRHSRQRDARAVRHHYDVSNEFFALFLDPSMTYSCAIFSGGAQTLASAQAAKLELVCQKLALDAGKRVLDIGCGWGSFAIHAAKHHGAEVVGVTLSAPQAELARRRVVEAGLQDRVEIRIADYREISDGPFDAIASIGMIEHVGARQIDAYAAQVARLLRPGGQVLNHGIARLRVGDPEAGPFSERFVFPDAAPLHLSTVIAALERAGLVTEHVEGFADDYAETLAHWARRLDERRAEATALVGPERLRVWRLYLRAARNGFLSGFTGVYQTRSSQPPPARSRASALQEATTGIEPV
jgi:cyclopropane-fatty-acyl-phospholipid synthase